MPQRYYRVLRDYYFMVHPPRKDEDGDDDFQTDGQVINFDKMDARKRMLMRNTWGEDSVKGDLV